MEPKTKIEIVWAEIVESAGQRAIEEGGFKLKRVDPHAKFDVYGGVDGAGCLMLAVGIKESPPAITLESGSLDYFRQKRVGGTWLMVLRLKELSLQAVFARLCQDLIDETASVANEAGLKSLVRDRLNLWKKLFEHGRSGLLEPFEIKGLLAELLVLEAIIKGGRRSALEAVTGWVGPLDADQDFLFSDEAVEVKAVGPGAEDVTISSLQQLVCAVPLRLSVRTLRASSQGEDTALGLNSLSLRIEGRLASEPDALSLFKGRLLEAGYVESPYYDTVLFEPGYEEEFPVTRAFPKLTVDTVPRGVVSAVYVVSLDQMRNKE